MGAQSSGALRYAGGSRSGREVAPLRLVVTTQPHVYNFHCCPDFFLSFSVPYRVVTPSRPDARSRQPQARRFYKILVKRMAVGEFVAAALEYTRLGDNDCRRSMREGGSGTSGTPASINVPECTQRGRRSSDQTSLWFRLVAGWSAGP